MKIICEFGNGSSRTATSKVRLVQKQTFYTNERVSKRLRDKCLGSEVGQPIDAHTGVHTEMMILIPQSASLTISNCSVLVISYDVEVGANQTLNAARNDLETNVQRLTGLLFLFPPGEPERVLWP